MAESLVQLADYQQAYAHLARLVTHPELPAELLPRAQFRLGETAYFIGRDTDAERALVGFCDTFPQSGLVAYALPYLADLAKRNGDDQGALQRYEAALREATGPLRDDCRFGRAECWYRLGQLSRARDEFVQLAQAAPPRIATAALYSLAMLEYTSGNHAAAISHFRSFRQRYPDDRRGSTAAYWQGIALVALNQHTDAHRTLAEAEKGLATTGSPLEPSCWFYLARSLQASGQLDQARWRYERLMDQFPEHPRAAEARAALKQLTSPPIVEDKLTEAVQSITRGQWEEALEVTANRDEPEAQLIAGRCCVELNRATEARARLGELYLQPHCPSALRTEAQRWVAESYRREGAYHPASREFLRVAANATDRHVRQSAFRDASECLTALGRIEAAAQLKQRAGDLACFEQERH